MLDFSQAAFLFQPLTLLTMLCGVFGGLLVGTMPGLTSTMAVALLVPITFGMSSEIGLTLLIAVYVGSISGGLVAATLLNIPGTPSSVATTFDAYPMAKKGQAGKALAYGVFASFLGGFFSFFGLVALAPLLGRFALRFGPYEYFALVVFTLTCIVSISRKSLVKGLLSAALGLFLATVGMSDTDGLPRFTFGSFFLLSGFSVMPVLIGMYAISQILEEVGVIHKPYRVIKANFSIGEFFAVAKSFKNSMHNLVRSILLGTGIGILPGTGSGLSNIVAYSQAKSAAKDPDSFGTGNPDGIIASESANNAAMGGALIPMLTLGIPGDATTMILLGALMIHGVQPGPLLMRDNAPLVFIIMLAFFLSNFFMLLIQMYFIPVLIKALTIPRSILYPVIAAMCVVGCYALNTNMSDVWVFFFMGLMGFAFNKLGFPILPLVLGLILGKMAESNLRVSILMGGGDLSGYLHRPIALTFLGVALLSILFSVRSMWKSRCEARKAAASA
ncbi:tripartite tricarboxylate transporter permease [Desulfocurvus sp. DL9XJH121]